MDLNPIVRVPLIVPLSWYGIGPFDIPDLTTVRNECLTFQLCSYGKNSYFYTCMDAYESSGNEEDSSSDTFRPWQDLAQPHRLLIPDEIQEWFTDFTRMMMVGAGWGRKYFPMNVNKSSPKTV